MSEGHRVPVRDKELVKAGYEAVGDAYTRERRMDSDDARLLDDFVTRLPRGGQVLDAGCGGGGPAARTLSPTVRVVGLDLAGAQLRLLRRNVPAALPVQGDLTHLPFRAESFDGIISVYAIIHVPREEHPALVREFHRALRTRGVALLCMGETDLPGEVGEYMGTRMFWSHFDKETNRRMLIEGGFRVLWDRSVRDFQAPSSRHRFFLAQKA